MAKKQFDNPAAAILAKMADTAPEQGTPAAEEQAEGVLKTQRVTFITTADTMRDLTDLVNYRIFRGQKVEGGIAGKTARKPSASIVLNEALREYLDKPETQKELSRYRALFS